MHYLPHDHLLLFHLASHVIKHHLHCVGWATLFASCRNCRTSRYGIRVLILLLSSLGDIGSPMKGPKSITCEYTIIRLTPLTCRSLAAIYLPISSIICCLVAEPEASMPCAGQYSSKTFFLTHGVFVTLIRIRKFTSSSHYNSTQKAINQLQLCWKQTTRRNLPGRKVSNQTSYQPAQTKL